jgi:hypothetical protein
VSLVIATHLQATSTRIVVLDPPPGDEPPEEESHELVKQTELASSIERTGKRQYSVRDPERFREKLQAGTNIALLRWAAQHASAKRFEAELGFQRSDTDWPDAPVDLLHADGVDYLGVATPLAPELGLSGPKAFRGLRADVLDNLKTGSATQSGLPNIQSHSIDDPLVSTGPLGTCFAIQDMQL